MFLSAHHHELSRLTYTPSPFPRRAPTPQPLSGKQTSILFWGRRFSLEAGMENYFQPLN